MTAVGVVQDPKKNAGKLKLLKSKAWPVPTHCHTGCAVANFWFCHALPMADCYTTERHSIHIQAWIPPALSAIHNFIQIHDPGKINDFTYEDNIDNRQAGGLALGPANVTERT
jgi:hypothetical protein